MRKTLFAASIIGLSIAVAPACATKGFVRTEVGGVNDKVETLSGTVEQAQERIGENEKRIGAVDQKAEQAARAAGEAQTAADAAAANAKEVDARLGSRIESTEKAMRRLVYEVTLSEDQANFRFGAAELPDAAKARLDEVVNQLKTNPQNVFIEIEGHTDNVGPTTLNEQLGLERAESVKRYLYEQHQVPLHKMNVISYGEDKPVAPNETRDGRAQNRRVVVRVLS